MASLLPNGRQQYTDSNGLPLVGGLLYTYEPGTTTLKSTYTTAAATVANTNPIVLNARGEATVFWGGSYKVKLTTALGVEVYTEDNISEPASALTLSGTTGAGLIGFLYAAVYGAGTIGKWLQDLALSAGSSFLGFIQAGSGAVATTAQAKMRERKSLLDWMSVGLQAAAASGTYTAQNRADMLVAANAAWDSALANDHDLYAPGGYRYELGEYSFPWRQSIVVDFLDCNNVTIYCDGPSTVFATVSEFGADVFQLNGVKNFHVKGFPTLTGTLTGTSASGSNGCSVTGGFDNITLEISPTNCQSIDKGATNDGGKGFTIQCDGATLEVGTIKATVRAKQCIQGFGFEAGLVNFLTKKVAVDVDLTAEDCYVACSISASAAVSAVPAGTHTGVRVRGQAINCQKDVFLGRAHGVEVDMQVITTKAEAARRLDPRSVAWFAGDAVVEALRCTYAKNSKIRVTGNKGACAFKAAIGGITAGSSGLSGATEYCDIFLDINGTASTENVYAVNSGGNTMTNSKLEVTATTASVMPPEFAVASGANILSIDGAYKGSFTATLVGVTASVTGTATWSILGNTVTLSFPALIGTSNTNGASITGLPAAIWPAATQFPQMLVVDNGAAIAGRALITAAGAMILNVLNSSTFNVANNKGLPDVTFSYQKF